MAEPPSLEPKVDEPAPVNEFGWREWIPGGRSDRRKNIYSPAEIAKQTEEIDRRLSAGQRFFNIAKDLRLPVGVVGQRARAVRRAWEKATLETREEMLGEQLAAIKAIYRKAIEGYDLSRNEKRPGGDPGLLVAANASLERAAKLFGLNAPELVGIAWGATVDSALKEARRRVAAELESSRREVLPALEASLADEPAPAPEPEPDASSN